MAAGQLELFDEQRVSEEFPEVPRLRVKTRKSEDRSAKTVKQGLPVDGPGTDVGERLQAIYAEVLLAYHIPSGRMRRRGDRLCPREQQLVHRRLEVNISREALNERDGPIMVAQAIGRTVARQLFYEGWPIQQRELESNRRPGQPLTA
jgi:hypothetical protein